MNTRLFLIDKLGTIENLKQIYFCRKDSDPIPKASLSSVIRLNIVMSGTKYITLPLAEGTEKVFFKPGDAHFSPSYTWEQQTWDSEHELMCIVPNPEYLRISYYIVNEKPELSKENIFYHTSHNYSELFLSTLKNLEKCSSPELQNAALSYGKALIELSIVECSKMVAERSNYLYRQIKEWIDNNYQYDITRDNIAKTFDLSPGYVSQLFKKSSGITLQDYITNTRIDFAKYLLKNTKLTVYQIAEQCGFNNYVYFVRRFREVCNISPGRYRALP